MFKIIFVEIVEFKFFLIVCWVINLIVCLVNCIGVNWLDGLLMIECVNVVYLRCVLNLVCVLFKLGYCIVLVFFMLMYFWWNV